MIVIEKDRSQTQLNFLIEKSCFISPRWLFMWLFMVDGDSELGEAQTVNALAAGQNQ